MADRAIEAVLFDLDGVIVFTDRYHRKSWEILAGRNGWKFSEDISRKLRGIPRMASLQVLLEYNGIDANDVQKAVFAGIKNDLYRQMLREELNRGDLYPGVLELLAALRSRTIKTALCSSSENAREVIKRLAIEDFFDAVVSGCDIEAAKPDPEIFLLGAQKLQAEPDKCLVFEDAEAGILAAKAAGMQTIGVGKDYCVPGADDHVRNYDAIDIDRMLKTGRVS